MGGWGWGVAQKWEMNNYGSARKPEAKELYENFGMNMKTVLQYVLRKNCVK
jgi:hypothetical protein